MASGIAISPKCDDAFAALNKRDYSCVVLKINKDMTAVELDRTVDVVSSDPHTAWKDFVKTLPSDEARYLLTDFAWKETPTVTKSKVVMITWTPESTAIRSKLIYAASLEIVTRKFPVQKTIQTTESDEIEYEVLKAQIAKS